MPNATITLTDDEQFFYDNAGWGYDPKRETAEHGRACGAVLLASAERQMQLTEGAEVTWEDDPEPWDGDVPWDGPVYGAVLRKGSEVLGSLWGITLAGELGSDPYCRVVAAELALEHL